jgi:hypothetical protein
MGREAGGGNVVGSTAFFLSAAYASVTTTQVMSADAIVSAPIVEVSCRAAVRFIRPLLYPLTAVAWSAFSI